MPSWKSPPPLFFPSLCNSYFRLVPFLQAHNRITTCFNLSRKPEGNSAHLHLPLSSLTKIPATHTWSSPLPTSVEGASFYLWSATLPRLLLYNLVPFSSRSSNYFFLRFSPISIKIFARFPGLNSSQRVSLSLSFWSQRNSIGNVGWAVQC